MFCFSIRNITACHSNSHYETSIFPFPPTLNRDKLQDNWQLLLIENYIQSWLLSKPSSRFYIFCEIWLLGQFGNSDRLRTILLCHFFRSDIESQRWMAKHFFSPLSSADLMMIFSRLYYSWILVNRKKRFFVRSLLPTKYLLPIKKPSIYLKDKFVSRELTLKPMLDSFWDIWWVF